MDTEPYEKNTPLYMYIHAELFGLLFGHHQYTINNSAWRNHYFTSTTLQTESNTTQF